MGMAVLASMSMPAPANANEFNLADRLSKNVKNLTRMQSRGAAILIPAEFQLALKTHERAMHHARAIVKLRAFQMDVLERRRAAQRAGRKASVETLESLSRWALLEIFEHDSAGVAVSETVDAVAHRFAVLRRIRWMLRENGYQTPELSGPDFPGAFRERVKTYVAALQQIRGALGLANAKSGDPVARAINQASAQSKAEAAALWVHRAGRPNLYPMTAWRR